MFTSITWLRWFLPVFPTVKLLLFPLYYCLVDPPPPAWTPTPHTCNGRPLHAILAPTPHAQPSLHADACSYPALALTLSFPRSRRSLSPTCFPHPTAGAHLTDGHPPFGPGHPMPDLAPAWTPCPHCSGWHSTPAWRPAAQMLGHPPHCALALTSHSRLPSHAPRSSPFKRHGD